MKPIKASIIALALAASWTPFNLWAQQNQAELLNQARVTKHQAKKIAWARVKDGTIKSVELGKEKVMQEVARLHLSGSGRSYKTREPAATASRQQNYGSLVKT